MILEIGNFYYYLTLILMVLLTVVCSLLLRNKNSKLTKYTLLGIALFNFLLHFLKILHPSYMANIKWSLIRMSMENICALSSVLLPIGILLKNNALKSYIYLISFLGGLMAVVISTDPVGKPLLEFDSIRYYICHYILFLVPVASCVAKEYKPKIKHALWMPLFFLCGQTIILLNELFLWGVGLVDYDIASFLSADFRNAAFVFGPNSAGAAITEKFMFMVPKVFRTNVFGISGVGDFYWPVIWLLIPSVIFFPIAYFLLTLPFTFKEVKLILKK